MADNNRNWNNQSSQSHQKWDQHRMNEENENRDRENYGNVSYGSDYNQNQGMRTGYGSKGYSGDSAHGREMENQGGYGGSGNMYGGAYSSDYGYQYGNQDRRTSGQKGWQKSGNENRYGQHNDWNQGNQNREDWGRGRVNTGSDYSNQGYGSDYGAQYGAEPYRGQRTRNMYGGDTSNYGNANQGGYDRGWWERTKDEVSSWFGDDDAERRRTRDEQQSGGYRGKGPKDYQRSEDRIREDVCDRLTDDDMLDATNINVQVQGNEVVLTGTVNNRDQKRRAEDLVEAISGVRNVENRIRVENNDGRNDMR
jgi:osmotically-inducible protein OsmY